LLPGFTLCIFRWRRSTRRAAITTRTHGFRFTLRTARVDLDNPCAVLITPRTGLKYCALRHGVPFHARRLTLTVRGFTWPGMRNHAGRSADHASISARCRGFRADHGDHLYVVLQSRYHSSDCHRLA
jgi:hypothetical protein